MHAGLTHPLMPKQYATHGFAPLLSEADGSGLNFQPLLPLLPLPPTGQKPPRVFKRSEKTSLFHLSHAPRPLCTGWAELDLAPLTRGPVPRLPGHFLNIYTHPELWRARPCTGAGSGSLPCQRGESHSARLLQEGRCTWRRCNARSSLSFLHLKRHVGTSGCRDSYIMMHTSRTAERFEATGWW